MVAMQKKERKKTYRVDTDKREVDIMDASEDNYRPVLCQNCGFVIGAIEDTQQVRCPACDRVIYHLGKKC